MTSILICCPSRAWRGSGMPVAAGPGSLKCAAQASAAGSKSSTVPWPTYQRLILTTSSNEGTKGGKHFSDLSHDLLGLPDNITGEDDLALRIDRRLGAHKNHSADAKSLHEGLRQGRKPACLRVGSRQFRAVGLSHRIAFNLDHHAGIGEIRHWHGCHRRLGSFRQRLGDSSQETWSRRRCRH